MKKVILLILINSSVFFAQAKCSFAITFFPNKGQISSNSFFYMGLYGFYDSLLDSIKDDKNILYLADSLNNHKVHLQIAEVYTDHPGGLTKVLLKPEKPLKVGHSYKICFNPYNKASLIDFYNPYYGKNPKMAYTVQVIEPDTVKPAIQEIIFCKNVSTLYGCGSKEVSIFELKGKNIDSTVFFKVKVEGENYQQTSIVFPSKDNTLRIGHEMCSGEFYLDSQKQYIAFVEVSDLAGNIANKTFKLPFTSPIDAEIQFSKHHINPKE